MQDKKDENQNLVFTDKTGVRFEAFSRERIHNDLRKFVSGQEKVLDKISFIAHLYSKKILWLKAGKDINLVPKLNMLITGPTGCGKTHIIKTLAATLKVPYHRIDCSTVTGEGWKGNNLSDRLAEFSDKSPSGVGIIHLDEFDKLGIPAQGSDSGRSDFIVSKQTNLLDLLDGSHSSPPGERSFNKKSSEEIESINNCLVIMTGSFQGFRDDQKKVKAPIGFASNEDENKIEIKNWRKELTKVGFIAELANRIITSEELDPYTKEDIEDILKNTENNAYKKHLNLGGVGEDYVKLSDEQINGLVETVHNSENGMREIESLIFELVYENELNSRKESENKDQ